MRAYTYVGVYNTKLHVNNTIKRSDRPVPSIQCTSIATSAASIVRAPRLASINFPKSTAHKTAKGIITPTKRQRWYHDDHDDNNTMTR